MQEKRSGVPPLFKTLAIVAAGLAAGPAIAQSGDPVIEEGRILFEETAGDVGCAMCHGMAATGDPDAGGPFIRGASEAQLNSALAGAVPVMDFIELTPPQKEAVVAYLQYLTYADETKLDPEALAGQVLFDEMAGGVGCAACHGDHGQGDVGPDIRGRDSVAILEQLRTNEQMSFIQLSQEEVDQVSAYLRYLHNQADH